MSSSVAHSTQSGVYTIVGNISEANLSCYESLANVELKANENRSDYNIILYRIDQNDLEKSLLLFNNTQNDSDHPFDLGMTNFFRIFDEYFAPNYFGVKNYFLDANMTLDKDVSSSSSSSELFMCFFSDRDTYYYKFTPSNETFWRSTNNCRSNILKSGEHRSVSETFVADQPSFLYIGIASTTPVDVHRIRLQGIGHDISGIAQNSTQPTICGVHKSTSQKNMNGMCMLNVSVYM